MKRIRRASRSIMPHSNIFDILKNISKENRQSVNFLVNIILEDYLKSKGYEIVFIEDIIPRNNEA